jgi:hypothetical protein
MKEERLKILLNKYYNGETSEAEEAELKEYFSGDRIIEGYDAEKEIFRYYSRSEIIPVPTEGFRERIVETVDDLEKSQGNIFARKRYIYIMSSAAAILILIGSYFIFFSQREPQDTFTDPQIAYAETMKILNEVSVKLNKGTQALKPLSQMHYATETGIYTLNRSTELISKNLQKIKLLKKISATGEQINDKNKK